MDLHNNYLGIIIEKGAPVEQTEIIKELEKMMGTGETIIDLQKFYPDLTLRQILIMKKIIESIEKGEAAIIWDKNY